MSNETKEQRFRSWTYGQWEFAKTLADTASNIGRWALMLGAIKYAAIHHPRLELIIASIILNIIFSYYIATLFVVKFDLGLVRTGRGKLMFVIGGLLHGVLVAACIWCVNHLTNTVIDALAQRPG